MGTAPRLALAALAVLAVFAALLLRAPGSAHAQQSYAAIVESDGDCLRMRAGPGIDFGVMVCLPDGLTVQVLPGEEQGPTYRWVAVTGAGRTGWVAAEFLRPIANAQAPAAEPTSAPATPSGATATVPPAATVAPATTPAATPTAPTQAEVDVALRGDYMPPPGTTGLVVSGGASTQALVAASAIRGCAVSSLWANGPRGSFIGYLAGAPDFVNRSWVERFSAGVPAGEPLIVVCDSAPPTPVVLAIPEPEPVASAPPPAIPTSGAPQQLEVELTYYYCAQGAIAQAIGDGGGFCGSSYAGTAVAPGLAACAPKFFGQRFRILGDPTGQVYRCDDLGSGVFEGHRDIWFADSDSAWAWWQVVGRNAVIEILPDEQA